MSSDHAQRVKKHRDELRANGLRPVQIWVPDTRQATFSEECKRQSLMLRSDSQEAQTLTWLEQVADTESWK